MASSADVPACVFCRIASGDLPAYRVVDTPDVVAFLDVKPLFPGHVLVVPRGHHETLADLPPERVAGFFAVVQALSVAVRDATGAQGTFVAMNNRVSQSVPHLHCHVVPRTKGDGLRGFFWPRTSYATPDHAAEVASRIAAAVAAAVPDAGGGDRQ